MKFFDAIKTVPDAARFPRTAHDLLTQAEALLQTKITMTSHTAARATGWSLNRDFAETVEKMHAGTTPSSAVVYHRPGLFGSAHILYRDGNPPWNGALHSDNHEYNVLGHTLTHEIAHIVAGLDGWRSVGIPANQKTFYLEQCAIAGGAALYATVGGRFVDNWTFPTLRAHQKFPDEMPFEAFSVYTPSPMARFFESKEGVAAARRRYLTPAGVLRFDRLSDDVVALGPHFRTHLTMLELFGDVALTLTNAFDGKDASALRISDKWRRGSGKRVSTYAAETLSSWWQEVAYLAGRKVAVPKNIYAGEIPVITSKEDAHRYFLDLATVVHIGLDERPSDRILQHVHSGIEHFVYSPQRAPPPLRGYARAQPDHP
ncbi:hypothetical protein [Bradyrhizobium acaciae]|uniref:hypothetical protein n=1 Tax=Bradyrhizobium acaciae TaxID=2683706 RepID=UPI001E453737|nr:hypothetical protein [Bradyrhizobium acaciae]MCC8978898.1 hypothetical protein [Bradyrhizobium acaciae]